MSSGTNVKREDTAAPVKDPLYLTLCPIYLIALVKRRQPRKVIEIPRERPIASWITVQPLEYVATQ
jgi:hypothetical protein